MKRPYHQIPYNTRTQIIRDVCYQQKKIKDVQFYKKCLITYKKVAKSQKVKVSTVKAILRTFKIEGRALAHTKGQFVKQVNHNECFHQFSMELPKKLENNSENLPPREFFNSYTIMIKSSVSCKFALKQNTKRFQQLIQKQNIMTNYQQQQNRNGCLNTSLSLTK